MSYQELLPHPALSARVDRFWLRAGEHGSRSVGAVWPPRYVLPDGCIDILIDLEARAVHVVGTMTSALVLRGPAVSMAAVRFRPGAGAALLGVAARELTDRRVPLAELGADWLSPRVLEAESPLAALRVLEASLLQQSCVVERSTGARRVEQAVRACFGPRPPAVAALARELDWSRQRLRQVLLDEVGLGAKDLLRVGRLQRAVAELQSRPALSLVETALGLGYCDQAHMCRDFRELVGVSPTLVRASPLTIFPIHSLLSGA